MGGCSSALRQLDRRAERAALPASGTQAATGGSVTKPTLKRCVVSRPSWESEPHRRLYRPKLEPTVDAMYTRYGNGSWLVACETLRHTHCIYPRARNG